MAQNGRGNTKRIIVKRKRRSDAGKSRGKRTASGTDSRNSGTGNTSTIGSGNEHNAASTASNGNTDNGDSILIASANNGSADANSGTRSDRGTGSDGTGNAPGNNGSDNADRSDAPGDGIGEPGPRKRGRRPGSKNKKTSLVLDDDVTDITNIVVAIGDGAKVATGYEGFEITAPEAETFAKPAARILARHGALAETIRTVADPFALLIAAASIAGPRIAGYKLYLQMQQGYAAIPPQEVVPSQRVVEPVPDAPAQHKGPLSDKQIVMQFMEGDALV